MNPARPAPAVEPGNSFASQCLSEFLARVQRVDPHPAVLDLGVLCGANIAFLASRGCRVSVESLPRSAAPAPAPAKVPSRVPSKAAPGKAPAEGAVATLPAPLPPLSYPSGSFSGVLAWDAIARMPSEEATAFVETLRRLLLAGGVVLAYFPGPPGRASDTAGRFRIVGEDRLTVEPTSGKILTQPSYQNREIYGLFSRFDVVRLSHLKSGTREVLVAKTRRAGRD